MIWLQFYKAEVDHDKFAPVNLLGHLGTHAELCNVML